MKPKVPDSMISPLPKALHDLDVPTNPTMADIAGVKRVSEGASEPTAAESADIANVGNERCHVHP